MINNFILLEKVLNYVAKHKQVILDERIMDGVAGFRQLADKGYIQIQKIEGQFFATLTNKGVETLADFQSAKR